MHEITRLLKKNEELERELRKQEGFVHLLGIWSHDIVWTWNLSSESVFWFGKFRQVLGYSMKEMPITFEGWRDLVHPEDREMYEHSLTQNLATGAHHRCAYRVRSKDGSMVHFEEIGGALRGKEDEGITFMGAIRNVTEANTMQKQIKNAKHLLYSFVDATSDIIFVRDSENQYRFVNNAFASLAQQEYRDILQENSPKFPSPELAEELDLLLNEVRNESREIERFIQAEGRIYLVKAFPVRQTDEQGSVGAILRDVTDQQFPK